MKKMKQRGEKGKEEDNRVKRRRRRKSNRGSVEDMISVRT